MCTLYPKFKKIQPELCFKARFANAAILMDTEDESCCYLDKNKVMFKVNG